MSALILDLSNVNSTVDFHRLKAVGVKGVMLKGTEGETYVDKTFVGRRVAAQLAGLYTGAYHFARPDLHLDPTSSAKAFCKLVGKLGSRDLKTALDFETWNKHLTPAQHISWARKFNAVVKAELGQYPMFYSYSAMLHDLASGTGGVPVGNGLWLASYARNTGKEYPAIVPAPWKAWVLHQYTSNGVVAGVSGTVDESSAPKLSAVQAHPVLALL